MLLYNNKLYQQVDGVSMACPLAPTMANFLLRHMETTMLKNKTSDHPQMYIRHLNNILQFSVMIIHACQFWRS